MKPFRVLFVAIFALCGAALLPNSARAGEPEASALTELESGFWSLGAGPDGTGAAGYVASRYSLSEGAYVRGMASSITVWGRPGYDRARSSRGSISFGIDAPQGEVALGAGVRVPEDNSAGPRLWPTIYLRAGDERGGRFQLGIGDDRGPLQGVLGIGTGYGFANRAALDFGLTLTEGAGPALWSELQAPMGSRGRLGVFGATGVNSYQKSTSTIGFRLQLEVGPMTADRRLR